MATQEDIKRKFLDMNIQVDGKVLEKCFGICKKYDLEAEDFCDQWYAYTITNLNGDAPSVPHLEKFERKEFQSSKAKKFLTPKAKPVEISDNLPHGYGKSLVEINSDLNTVASSSSSSATPKQKPATIQNNATPQKPLSSRNISYDFDNKDELNVSYSEKYSQRSDSRSVQCTYGATTDFKRGASSPLTIRNMFEGLTKMRYMFEVMGQKAGALMDMTDELGHAILDANALLLSEGPLRVHMGDMTTYGRVVSDSDKKINQHSVLLEGTHETNACFTTILNLQKVPRYLLFPGQVIVVEGNNMNANTFVAEKIYADAMLSMPEEIPLMTEKMQIVVAAGPFTLQDSLSYDPLYDLLKYVNEKEPNVLILMGPFLDRTQENIVNLTQTFDSFFEGLIENIMNSLLNVELQVIVVASSKDAHHHPVYPTPPYQIREKYPNLTFLPDPCMFTVNGLMFGVTTADILFHISNFEIFCDINLNAPADRMGRIASHLLSQGSFYPLCPPHKDISMDHDLFKQFCLMPCKPHILILPSNLKHFVKNIKDCLVINPERLTKGFSGTFATIEVRPGHTSSICSRASCQILRI